MKVSEWDLFSDGRKEGGGKRRRNNASCAFALSLSPRLSWARFRVTTKKKKKEKGEGGGKGEKRSDERESEEEGEEDDDVDASSLPFLPSYLYHLTLSLPLLSVCIFF